MSLRNTTIERHDETAIRIAEGSAMHEGWDDYADERGWKGVGIAPCGRHRDSDALERSNHVTVVALLDDIGPDGHDIADFGHWAVGWIEEITYDLGNADMAAAVADIRARVEDYPSLDDDLFSTYEWEENHNDEGYCYADRDMECHRTDDSRRILEDEGD
jgi:hypothetical protein